MVFVQSSQHLQPCKPWHVDIEHDQMDLHLTDNLQTLNSIASQLGGVPKPIKRGTQRLSQRHVIVSDQQSWGDQFHFSISK
jgi:hypothetical protein